MNELIEKWHSGGIAMYFIAICLGVGLAIVMDRFMVLRAAASVNKDEVLNHLNSYILQGNLEKAISLTSQIKNPLTNIIRSGLVAVQNSKDPEEIQTAMDASALKEVPRIEKRIGLLATVANISTLFGLMGTINGLIRAFASVANVAPAEKAAILTGAISEALVATLFGLSTAILCLAFFGLFSTWAQSLVDDIHESAVSTLNFIITNRNKLIKG